MDAHANQESDVTLTVANTGNVDLENVSVNCSAPSGWTVTYELEDNMIESIPAGSTTEVIAHVKPSSDAITGDYAATFTAKTDEASDSAEFRISVKNPDHLGICGHCDHPRRCRRTELCVQEIRKTIARESRKEESIWIRWNGSSYIRKGLPNAMVKKRLFRS